MSNLIYAQVHHSNWELNNIVIYFTWPSRFYWLHLEGYMDYGIFPSPCLEKFLSMRPPKLYHNGVCHHWFPFICQTLYLISCIHVGIFAHFIFHSDTTGKCLFHRHVSQQHEGHQITFTVIHNCQKYGTSKTFFLFQASCIGYIMFMDSEKESIHSVI